MHETRGTTALQVKPRGKPLMFVLMAGCLAFNAIAALAKAPQKPRLVLQVTVDALRGDLPQRHLHNMGKGGFRYLFDNGVHYTNAHYEHANTETVVGHSSLATGTTPALHGMIGNVWFDKDLNRLVYNVEDDRYHLLSANADVDKSTELDPTQRVATADGRSPRALLTSTFSDELAYAYNGRAKIFAVSVKDRGAIPLAGQTGKAFWFSKAAGQFISSSYYYPRFPQWVQDWNNADPLVRFRGEAWELLKPAEDYLFGKQDEQSWETNFPGYGITFPHPWGGAADDKYFTTKLTLGPAGDELVLDFAKVLIERENLGKDAIPDYLSVSFSSHDYVNHLFGPSSLEAEDVLLQLDRTLADLFSHIDKTVGLEHTLIVLSADHGTPDALPYLNLRGDQNSDYYDMANCMQSTESGLAQAYPDTEGLLGEFSHPYIYLDQAVIKTAGLDEVEVAQIAATLVARCQGITAAIVTAGSQNAPPPTTSVETRVWNNFNPRRSGDVHVVLDSNVYVNDFDGLIVAATHGSPWNYDTFVPIFFAGHGINQANISRRVTPYDIAPTLSAAVGIKPPSGSVGNPLEGVLAR